MSGRKEGEEGEKGKKKGEDAAGQSCEGRVKMHCHHHAKRGIGGRRCLMAQSASFVRRMVGDWTRDLVHLREVGIA